MLGRGMDLDFDITNRASAAETEAWPDYSAAEKKVADKLIAEHYDLLTRVARSKRRRMNVNDTLCTSEILHEAYFKLNDKTNWVSSEHFIRCATLAMRCVIVDHARKKLTNKRGSGAEKISLEESEGVMPEFAETPEEIVGISRLLEKLGTTNPRWMRVVDARYFSGMTEAETAEALEMNARTVRRDWHDAREWMAVQLQVS